MKRRSLIPFVILNILISLGVAIGAIAWINSNPPTQAPVSVITVEIRITNTPDPNATPSVRIITATPLPGAGLTVTAPQVAQLPEGLLPDQADASTVLPTIDAAALGESADLAGTATALPEFCIPHVLKEGDTPFAVAEIYGADPFLLLEVNGLDEVTSAFLQVGQVLIVPLPGCPLSAPSPASAETEVVEAAPTEAISQTPTTGPTLTPTITSTPPPTIRPTVTLPPTAANAVVRIVEVLNDGDITAESIAIRNTGQTVSIGGWTLSDDDDNTYTFAEQSLFQNGQITLFTRVGTNSPIVLYWGRDQAVFESGDTITLRDANGGVQATYRVP
jgi:hypothetical protein